MGLEYGYMDQLSFAAPWMLDWGNPLILLFWVGIWVEFKARRTLTQEKQR